MSGNKKEINSFYNVVVTLPATSTKNVPETSKELSKAYKSQVRSYLWQWHIERFNHAIRDMQCHSDQFCKGKHKEWHFTKADASGHIKENATTKCLIVIFSPMFLTIWS